MLLLGKYLDKHFNEQLFDTTSCKYGGGQVLRHCESSLKRPDEQVKQSAFVPPPQEAQAALQGVQISVSLFS